MSNVNQTPASVLDSLIRKYQLNPFLLSKAISLNYSTVHQILKGKAKITVPTALRFAKFFGQPSTFWLDLQQTEDLNEAAKDKNLSSVLKGISKVKKPSAKMPASEPKATTRLAKRNALSAKRKKAAKVPGAKAARGKRR